MAAKLFLVYQGTTSACAENTSSEFPATPWQRNYLRVRGEYFVVGFTALGLVELPPRARRIHEGDFLGSAQIGTTSACAENTGNSFPGAIHFWNYLRVRGEYGRLLLSQGSLAELPPRARRIHLVEQDLAFMGGTTSACAENTQIMPVAQIEKRNYLRVRGEYWLRIISLLRLMELPPRARRILSTVAAP